MAFKRALWHSGLTYCQTCPVCKTEVRYTDYELDFRPWYPDGYVDCPKCMGHLRHNEAYAIDAAEESFCTACGRKLGQNDKFCAGCGAKRA